MTETKAIAMDTLDQQLIALLRLDARASVATLALKLKVARGTVANRITKLEDSGVINGYTVKLRPEATPNQITAWMSIAVEGNKTREVISILLGEPGVSGLFDTNGRWDQRSLGPAGRAERAQSGRVGQCAGAGASDQGY